LQDLSDPKGEVAKAYGVRVFFGFCSRDTILINPENNVEKIIQRCGSICRCKESFRIHRKVKRLT